MENSAYKELINLRRSGNSFCVYLDQKLEKGPEITERIKVSTSEEDWDKMRPGQA